MRKLNIVASIAAVAGLGLSAMAQDNPPPRGKDRQPGAQRGQGMGMGQQLAPEKAKAAQEAEATGVAKRLGLSDDQTKTLVKAYTDARASHTAAMDKARKDMRDKAGGGGAGGDGGDRRAMGQEMQKQMEEVNKTEREKFEKALGSAIPADSKTKAVASLGTFVQQWDRWVDSVSEFKLDAKKNQEALNAIEDFVVAQSKIRPGGADPEEARTARQEARTKLTDSMKKILSEEQFTKFEQGLGGGRRGGGGGGGRGGDGAGGGGGGF